MKVHTNKLGYFGEGSVEVAAPAGPGEGPTRRCTLSKDGLVTQPFEGIDTVYDIVAYAARTHGSRKALGWRDVVNVIEEEKEVTKVIDGQAVKEKKKWKFFELSDYKYLSFIEVKEAVSEIARALIHLGVTSDDVINVYSQTRCATPT
jgi:long-chain acyl-CoA synthetase